MKSVCEVCTTAPATLMCVADDAVMCGTCDKSVHSANAVVAKHERVAFASTGEKINCDICQVNPVYTICHEDRAFLCRGCDVSLHSANEAVKKHRRFLYTGVTVALAPLGEKETATPREATDIVKEVPPMAAPIRPTVTQPQPQKKRKAVDIEDDFAVPTMSPDNSAGHGGVQWQSDEEFNSFVQDFVGKGEKNPDVNFDGFLDNFFDDVPLSDDFGVVPTM